MKSTWFAVFLIGSSVALTGCGDSETEAPGETERAIAPAAATGASANPLLGSVDAGTEYLFANVSRLSDEVLEKYWALNEASSLTNQAMFDEITNDDEVPPAAAALVRELSNITTREGWTAAGMHENPFYAFHSVNLLPFAEIELADQAAFAALIGRVEASLEEPLVRRDVDGAEVIWIEIETGFGVALHG